MNTFCYKYWLLNVKIWLKKGLIYFILNSIWSSVDQQVMKLSPSKSLDCKYLEGQIFIKLLQMTLLSYVKSHF